MASSSPQAALNAGILGVGAIAEAIVTGLCDGSDDPPSIHLSPRGAERAGRLAARHPSVDLADSNQAVVDRAEVILVCVRPPDAAAVLSHLRFRTEQTVISVLGGVPVAEVRPLVAPAEVIVRAIPLPAVATRTGITAIHPPNELTQAIFEPLGGVVALEVERELDTLAVATDALAAHLAYLETITRWLVRRGIGEAEASRYVAGVFGGLSAELLDGEPKDFGAYAAEFATPGGFNEQVLDSLREAGTFDDVERALDGIGERLKLD